MYSTKLFYAIEGQALENNINQFLWTHHREIEEVVSISINNAPKSYIACLMYKQKV